MSLKAVLFDLDGTLLPMDQEVFVKAYFKELAAKLAPHGYEPEGLIKSIWNGTGAMVKNDGSRNNEEVFWEAFRSIYGERVMGDLQYFDDFYRNEFQKAQSACGFNAMAAEVVHKIQNKGIRVALATNPIFPAVATESRIRWVGLEPEDFEIYTTYENIGYCKPNPEYYREILRRMDVKPEECLMVGNDVTEDMVAETIGMDVFLLTDCLINKEEKDISQYKQGSFAELVEFLGLE
ncbi:MAG: HAD family hydrolase [Agathobacter sp.]|nr:HAD family hydrolase [Agathobacter sp.]MBQ2283627.1 HAD family hydrolase [Agathobacter sp.]